MSFHMCNCPKEIEDCKYCQEIKMIIEIKDMGGVPNYLWLSGLFSEVVPDES